MVAFFGVRVDEGWRERDFLLDVDDGSVRSSFMLPARSSVSAGCKHTVMLSPSNRARRSIKLAACAPLKHAYA